jgi:RNA polymerase sigma-70 factor (ECF subfamily)
VWRSALATILNSRSFRVAAFQRPRSVDLRGSAIPLIESQSSRRTLPQANIKKSERFGRLHALYYLQMQNALSIASGADPAQEAGEGARHSFDSLVERNAQLVYRIALAVTRNPHDAEDVAQETFLQLYRGGRWEQIEDQRGYLARVAWRLAARQRSAQARSQELPAQMVSMEASPEESAIDAEQEASLHAHIDSLPEKLRQPLALAALAELKLVEIASILGLPEGTVRRRIHTARQKLRQAMTKGKGGGHDR